MKKSPLVTVYITNYNYEKYIQQSIESVLSQSFQNFELIIIDDGSQDCSHDIIETYRNNNKITIIYQKNKGLNITNNVAMRIAKGKYIMRLDADDFLAEDALERMVELLEKDDKLGLVFPDYFYADESGNVIGQEVRHDFEKEVSLFDQPAHGACTMIRLSFLKDIGGYNESFTCQDGYDLWLKFVFNYTVNNIDKPLFYYRRHGNNLTNNEGKILATRRAIKQTFLKNYDVNNCTLIVIPVRETLIDGFNWPLYDKNNNSILVDKINTCLKANCLVEVLVVSSDNDILEHCKTNFKFSNRVRLLKRPSFYANPNKTLASTINMAIEDAVKRNVKFSFIMTVTIDFPFTTHHLIDDAVNTLILFKTDAVLSVRLDNHMYYQHTGHTLQPILDQEKFTRIEREALYKAAGGVSVCTLRSFKENGKINSGVISHIVVDEKTAFQVNSSFQFKIYNSLMGIIKAE